VSVALASLFVTAIELTGNQRLVLMWPLCLAVAIVYKTTRTEALSSVPKTAVVLWATIIFGMYVVGIVLWAIFGLLV